MLACWEAAHADGWLVLTDLPPERAKVAWYGLRGWIEHGFKDLKRGGWGWHHTKMHAPAEHAASGFAALPATHHARHTRRHLSLFRRGRLVTLVAVVRGQRLPLGFFPLVGRAGTTKRGLRGFPGTHVMIYLPLLVQSSEDSFECGGQPRAGRNGNRVDPPASQQRAKRGIGVVIKQQALARADGLRP